MTFLEEMTRKVENDEIDLEGLLGKLASERALRVKAEQRIADAPHHLNCDWDNSEDPECNCWKSEENS